MKDFLRPTKDKIIFTFVIPSYFLLAFDLEAGKLGGIWLPIPIIFIIAAILFLVYRMPYDSRINFILQKLEQEHLQKNPTALQGILMVIAILLPLFFNYILACFFFRWYYKRIR
jgi:hypothetical protein